MKVNPDLITAKQSLLGGMENERSQFKPMWRECADYILPTRYSWLLSETERRKKMTKNPNIIDGTGTKAAKTLAAGMLNGITSPSRPWFKLRIKNDLLNANWAVRRWLDQVERLMLQTMAGTNFYNSLAVMYLDLSVFGSSAVLIYEDPQSVFRCYGSCLGEFHFRNGASGMVNTFAREFRYSASQCVERFGEKNVTDEIRLAAKAADGKSTQMYDVVHLIEPNDGKLAGVPKVMPVREMYWLKNTQSRDGHILGAAGYNELPGIFPRWEVSGSDSYGSSPGMDALGDIIQLQHESKRKAQGLDYTLRPPMKADIQLQHRPTALLPGGMTFVAGANNVGIEPAYQVQFPFDAITLDIKDVQQRIKEIFHNPLFTMISDLETVRTATEIDAKREEKLVMLGSVLERFENEALDPAISRIYSIMDRAGLIPPPPRGLEREEIEIQYVSILSAAQSAIGVAPLERWLALVGQTASMYPAALNVPNWDELLRDYGRDIGVKAKHILSPEETAERTRAQEQLLAQREAANQGSVLAQGAKTLSETDVGGGANALQMMMAA